MFVAHAFVGYLCTKLLLKTTKTDQNIKLSYFAGILGSIFPDFDMIWFYTIGQRATHHHEYITHKPLFWLLVAVIICGYLWQKRSDLLVVFIAFFSNVIGHIALDSIAGKTMWLWPFSDVTTTLVVVPAKHDFWVWSFVDHWTFMVEILIVITAFVVYFRSKKIEARA